MLKQVSQTDELIDKWDVRREVQNLMGKYTYCFLLHKEGELFERFWSKKADICLGLNEGWYAGPEAVKGYFEALCGLTLLNSRLLQRAFPDRLGDWSDEKLYGVGLQDHKPICNQIIEVADDLHTAKGLWHCQGKYDAITPSGPLSYWTWGWFAADFVYDGGEWRIWHLQQLQDIDSPCGHKWGRSYVEEEPIPPFGEIADYKLPEPTVPTVLREHYGTLRPYTEPPQLPEPYGTFEDTFSYGMDGGR